MLIHSRLISLAILLASLAMVISLLVSSNAAIADDPATTSLPATQVATGPAAGTLDPSQVYALWQRIRRADADSDELHKAQQETQALLKPLLAEDHVVAATAMMDERADDPSNLGALEFLVDTLGGDCLMYEILDKEILSRPERSARQRVLLLTCYEFLLKKEDRQPAQGQRLVGSLVDRLEALTNAAEGRSADIDLSEQRLLINLCQRALTALDARPETFAARDKLLEAMNALDKACSQARGNVALCQAIQGWQRIRKAAKGPADSVDAAIECLGHWDADVRRQASAALANQLQKNVSLIERLWPAMDDPRDEVRAAAVTVLVFARDLQSPRVTDKLESVLSQDRGLAVQSSAAEALMARGPQAKAAIEPLLKLFDSRPGPRRTEYVLLALSRMVGQATSAQKDQFFVLAKANLADAPRGCLEMLKALGPQAKPAIKKVRAYRENADRAERLYIDGQVLPAIERR